MKPLIFIPSPRDIPQFAESVKAITEYDRLWVKYLPEQEAYRKARTFFLNHDYTHLVILPDDLIVTPEDIEVLCEDTRFNNYPIISGITNIDDGETFRGKYCVAEHLPTFNGDMTLGSYKWYTEEERQGRLAMLHVVIQVKHIGFPLTFIRRDIIEDVIFRVHPTFSCCVDVQFCIDCDRLNIPIFVDLLVVGKHLKREGRTYDNWGLASKNPIAKLDKAGEESTTYLYLKNMTE